jgi:uncharacterized protein (UPF0303 family)
MGIEEDVTRLKMQEEWLQFLAFTEDDAWRLGNLMRERAVARKLPVVIDILCAGRKLFYAALPGTNPDNEDWVRRKVNVVMRFHKSSYRMGRELARDGKAFDESRGLVPLDYAPHGGCFPVSIKDAGVVGAITVSGLPQREDHNFVVECLCEFLGVPVAEVALGVEATA